MKPDSFSTIRREYGTRALSEKNVLPDPVAQFKVWFDEVVSDEIEPTAMTIATVDSTGMPDARIVLLKGVDDAGHFIFFTHYDSAKGSEITQNNKVALNFFWSKWVRQVKIRGIIQKVSSEVSDNYFASRPWLSQLSATASHQSQVIASREILEQRILKLQTEYSNEKIPRPKQWGGYAVIPIEVEFWQGRDNRLHDRVRYRKENEQWIIERLSP